MLLTRQRQRHPAANGSIRSRFNFLPPPNRLEDKNPVSGKSRLRKIFRSENMVDYYGCERK